MILIYLHGRRGTSSCTEINNLCTLLLRFIKRAKILRLHTYRNRQKPIILTIHAHFEFCKILIVEVNFYMQILWANLHDFTLTNPLLIHKWFGVYNMKDNRNKVKSFLILIKHSPIYDDNRDRNTADNSRGSTTVRIPLDL